MGCRVSPGVTIRPVQRLDPTGGDLLPDAPGSQRDAIAVEEPLEILVDGAPVAITMRTPGADGYLALGFLHGEGVLRSIDEVAAVTPCWRPGEDGAAGAIDVRSSPGASLEFERALDSKRFSVLASARAAALPEGPTLAPALVSSCVERLRAAQPQLDRTGGLHAAAAWSAGGDLLAAHQDVGRHNAVDKVVGELLRRRRIGACADAPPAERPALLVVSGRASFEIVQKAAAAGVPVVACASAASSLAIDLAVAARVTLVAFVRGRSLSVYACPERLGAVYAGRRERSE